MTSEDSISYIRSIELDLFKRLDRISKGIETEHDMKEFVACSAIYSKFSATKDHSVSEISFKEPKKTKRKKSKLIKLKMENDLDKELIKHHYEVADGLLKIYKRDLATYELYNRMPGRLYDISLTWSNNHHSNKEDKELAELIKSVTSKI